MCLCADLNERGEHKQCHLLGIGAVVNAWPRPLLVGGVSIVNFNLWSRNKLQHKHGDRNYQTEDEHGTPPTISFYEEIV